MILQINELVLNLAEWKIIIKLQSEIQIDEPRKNYFLRLLYETVKKMNSFIDNIE